LEYKKTINKTYQAYLHNVLAYNSYCSPLQVAVWW